MPAHDRQHDDAMPSASVHSKDALSAAATRYRVPIEAAGIWCDYEAAMSQWFHRCGSILMDMLTTPERYLTDMFRRFAAKHKYRMPAMDEDRWREALDDNRRELLAMNPGWSFLAIAAAINGDMGSRRDTHTMTRMANLGWLPRRPSRPDATARRRDPQTEAERDARAEAIVDDLMSQS